MPNKGHYVRDPICRKCSKFAKSVFRQFLISNVCVCAREGGEGSRWPFKKKKNCGMTTCFWFILSFLFDDGGFRFWPPSFFFAASLRHRCCPLSVAAKPEPVSVGI